MEVEVDKRDKELLDNLGISVQDFFKWAIVELKIHLKRKNGFFKGVFFLGLLFLAPLTSALVIGSSNITGVSITQPTLPTFDNVTASVNHSNSTLWWITTDLGPLDAASDIGSSDITDDGNFVEVAGDTMTGPLWSNSNITTTGDINSTDLEATGTLTVNSPTGDTITLDKLGGSGQAWNFRSNGAGGTFQFWENFNGNSALNIKSTPGYHAILNIDGQSVFNMDASDGYCQVLIGAGIDYRLFAGASEGETPHLRVYGWETGGGTRDYLNIEAVIEGMEISAEDGLISFADEDLLIGGDINQTAGNSTINIPVSEAFMNHTNTTTIPIPAADTYVILNSTYNVTIGEQSGVYYNGSGFITPIPGLYKIDYYASFSGGNGDEIHFNIGVNDNETTGKCHSVRDAGSASAVGSVSGQCLRRTNSGDIIYWLAENDQDSEDFDLIDGNIIVWRING